jgi:hypothetical protein
MSTTTTTTNTTNNTASTNPAPSQAIPDGELRELGPTAQGYTRPRPTPTTTESRTASYPHTSQNATTTTNRTSQDGKEEPMMFEMDP